MKLGRRPDPECIKSNRASGAGICMVRQKCDRTNSHYGFRARGRPGSIAQSGCIILILPNEYNSEFQDRHGRLSGFNASSLGRGSRARPDQSCCGMLTLFKPVISTRLVRTARQAPHRLSLRIAPQRFRSVGLFPLSSVGRRSTNCRPGWGFPGAAPAAAATAAGFRE
jgi:hypothetical protein